VSKETPHQPRSESEFFAAAAAAVARGDDLDDTLAELLGLAAERATARAGAVYILDSDRDELELAVTLRVAPDAAADAGTVKDATTSHDPLASAARSRHPLEVDDAGRVPVLRGAKTAFVVPLIARRDGIEISLGTMALGFAGPLPGGEILAGVQPFADLAAVAVERALALAMGSERAEWFDRLANIDQLTGLANRRTVDRLLEMEVARAGRQGAALSIALFQVDRFEEIQRTGGNAAGDDALRRVAQILAESVRLVDTVARYAGDQFMLLAPGPDGLIVTERLVRGIAALPPAKDGAITVSAGIASFPMDGRTPEELLAVAERATQSASKAGGGRVVAEMASTEPGATD
jgi:diguanylate cyclase (GGDEF)-like protein